MLKPIVLLSMLLLGTAGCESDQQAGDEQAATSTKERGGTITVGDESWVIVLSTQCSVYPGDVVSIAGHAASDPELEIVIDYGGPNGARIGSDGGGSGSWHAVRETLEVEIDGKRVRGTATFSEFFGGGGESRPGSFDVQC